VCDREKIPFQVPGLAAAAEWALGSETCTNAPGQPTIRASSSSRSSRPAIRPTCTWCSRDFRPAPSRSRKRRRFCSAALQNRRPVQARTAQRRAACLTAESSRQSAFRPLAFSSLCQAMSVGSRRRSASRPMVRKSKSRRRTVSRSARHFAPCRPCTGHIRTHRSSISLIGVRSDLATQT
jgi:hypothetical protein